MSPVKGVNCWAIQVPPFTPQDTPWIAGSTIRLTRKQAIEHLFGKSRKVWKRYYRIGYRAVKVRVEIAGGP